ncbi:MAG: hypothetical protein RJA36_1491 [Pseudomonadota bacterium]|jgi:Holliday junction resolvase RusA-like endonuclease
MSRGGPTEAQLQLLGYDTTTGKRRPAPPPSPPPLPPTAYAESAPSRPPVSPQVGYDFVDATWNHLLIGKGRNRWSTRNGVPHMHTPQKTIDAEKDLKGVLTLALPPGFELIRFPVQLLIDVRKAITLSWSKRKKADAEANLIRPTAKPDSDNIIKLVSDAANKVVWVDDTQVVDIQLVRYFAPVEGLRIRVRRAPSPPFWEHIA